VSKGQADDVTAVREIIPVSRETEAKLEAFVGLLRSWHGAVPVVAGAALPELWRRHVADCTQLVRVRPDARLWVDIGSGGGFPGLVVAIVGGEGTHVDLIESNGRKCAFLREAIRLTGAPAAVHQGRAETLLRSRASIPDAISARAVAPLAELLALAEPLMSNGAPGLFHKGRDFKAEVAEATQSWEFDLVEHKSRIGDGVILEVQNLRRRQGHG
jgi:16S rRNA (guanine527-N7)-methyltransferase